MPIVSQSASDSYSLFPPYLMLCAPRIAGLLPANVPIHEPTPDPDLFYADLQAAAEQIHAVLKRSPELSKSKPAIRILNRLHAEIGMAMVGRKRPFLGMDLLFNPDTGKPFPTKEEVEAEFNAVTHRTLDAARKLFDTFLASNDPLSKRETWHITEGDHERTDA